MGVTGKLGLPTGAAALAAALCWALRGPPTPELPTEVATPEKDFALFTHANNELHCMERELRHPCVRELREHIEKRTSEAKETALECLRHELKTNDYYVLKNMTHLLLDLDTVNHAFDRGSRDNDFVMAGVDFARELMAHPTCLGDFDEKSELECRCVPLYAKVATMKLKNAGKQEEALAMFRDVTSLSWQGVKRSYAAGEAVPWPHPQQTPQIYVRGLRSFQVWPRELWPQMPICGLLEANFETIREETERAARLGKEEGWEDTYRFLYDHGEWHNLKLYHGRNFTPECEALFPRTCALLKQWLPSKPGLPWTSDQNEQIMIIRMAPGTEVETHSGPSNNILNIHLGISGLEGAKLTVGNGTYGWKEGEVIAWDGSVDHKVSCAECKEDRVILAARYMHPDMSAEHYRGVARTHFEEVPPELQQR